MLDTIEQGKAHIRGIWEYRWTAMVLAWLLAIAGWSFVHYMPDKYQASTRVYIDSDSVLRPLLKGLAVETDVEQQLKLMTRTLLNRPNVEKIMRMTDLDIRVKTPDAKEMMISRLTNSIQIKKMGRERDINLYQITYSDSDRNLAKEVVQSLLTILIEGSLGDKREDSDSATKFLTGQINEYEQRLIAAEDRLTLFKQKNVSVLPEQGRSYYQNLQAYKDNLSKAALALQESKDRRNSIKRELNALLKVSRLNKDRSHLINSPLNARILSLQTMLDEMLLTFTAEYPNVQELRYKIAGLKERQKKDEENQLKSGSVEAGFENNVLYQELKISLSGEEADVAALSSRTAEYAKRIIKLEEQIETLPKIEAELKRLDRDYINDKKNYNTLIERRESAKMAARADLEGDSIKFRIIDPPWVPYSPSEPNRPVLQSMVLLAAIAAGLAISFLLSQLRPVVYDYKTLQQLTGIPVWGGVSLSLTEEELKANKKQLIIITTVFILLLLAYVLVMLVELKKIGLLTNVLRMIGM